MSSLIKLHEPHLWVVRQIHPSRSVSNQQLAEKGLAIGNETDIGERSYQRRLFGLGSSQLQRLYRIPAGKWPVWVSEDLESAQKRYLHPEQEVVASQSRKAILPRDKEVVYMAKIDLNQLQLATNIPVVAEGEHGSAQTRLELVEFTNEDNESHYRLRAATSREALQPALKTCFDQEGYLLAGGIQVGSELFGHKWDGEFYLDNYQGPEQFLSEHIWRWQEGQFIEITDKVLALREDVEGHQEVRRDLQRGRGKEG